MFLVVNEAVSVKHWTATVLDRLSAGKTCSLSAIQRDFRLYYYILGESVVQGGRCRGRRRDVQFGRGVWSCGTIIAVVGCGRDPLLAHDACTWTRLRALRASSSSPSSHHIDTRTLFYPRRYSSPPYLLFITDSHLFNTTEAHPRAVLSFTSP